MGKSCLSSPIFIQEQISFRCQHLVMSSTGNTNPGNFANRPREEVQEIASKGGQSRGAANSGGSDDTAGTTSAAGNTNPGNFANRPKAEKRRAAPLSLAVTRRVRLEAREDRLVDVGIT